MRRILKIYFVLFPGSLADPCGLYRSSRVEVHWVDGGFRLPGRYWVREWIFDSEFAGGYVRDV